MKVKCAIYLLLLALSGCTSESRRAEMTAVLDRAQQQNLAYDSITHVDSIAQAASFFDRHGTPNEQLRAHYLLGCAYRDMGEAPAALQSFQDAVDRADTLSSDCDYRRLMTVYGQMTDLFHAQNLPTDEIISCTQANRFARLAKDTLSSILTYELLSKPYFLLGDTDKVIDIIEKTHSQYIEHGYISESFNGYGTLIHFNICRGHLEKAFQMMKDFEYHSNQFDSLGNISSGREMYYYIKGNYYLLRHVVDSAEHFMRRLSSFSSFKADAYRGLLSVYTQKKNADSISKYAFLYEEAIDHQNVSKRTEVIHQMTSLYKYQRFQKKADQAEILVVKTRMCFGFLLALTFFVLIMLIFRYVHIKKKRNEAEQKYKENLRYLRETEVELSQLRLHDMDYRELIMKKEQQIKLLKQEIISFEQVTHIYHSSAESQLEKMDVYLHFHELAAVGRTPSDKDWQELYQKVQDLFPNFYELLVRHLHEIGQTGYKTCILIRIHIPVKGIGNLLGFSSAYITKIRKQMSKPLFGKKLSSVEFDKELLLIS